MVPDECNRFLINRTRNSVAPNKYRADKLLMYELGYEDSVLTSSPNQDADKACAGIIEKYNAFQGVLKTGITWLEHEIAFEERSTKTLK